MRTQGRPCKEAPGPSFHVRRWDDGGEFIAHRLYVREFLIEEDFACEREKASQYNCRYVDLVKE